MEERVLIYRNQGAIKHAKIGYNNMQSRLQKLYDALKGLDIEPTLEMISEIVDNGNWRSVEAQLEKELAEQPKALRTLIAKQNKENVFNIKINQVKDVLEISQNYIVPIEHFSIENSRVVISPEVEGLLDEQFSIYADSEGRKSVLDAIDALRAAQVALDKAVEAAAKRPMTPLEERASKSIYSSPLHFPDDIRGLRPIGEFALAALDLDGSIVIKGENFSYLK